MAIELSRIAIGAKVVSAECHAELNTTTLEMALSWKNTTNGRATRSSDRIGKGGGNFGLKDGTLETFVVYFRSNDEMKESASDEAERVPDDVGVDSKEVDPMEHLGPFVALGIKPTEQNFLRKFAKAYRRDHHKPKHRHLILEFRDLEVMKNFTEYCKSKLQEAVRLKVIEKKECAKYAQSLLDNSKKETNEMRQSKFIAGRALDSTLLVYPFAGVPTEIGSAAEGLTEAAGNIKFDEMCKGEDTALASTGDGGSNNEGKAKQRAHMVTINVEDYTRLEPGEWLNDSLVDLWMQWCVLYRTHLFIFLRRLIRWNFFPQDFSRRHDAELEISFLHVPLFHDFGI